jgi:DNA adenine methylase
MKSFLRWAGSKRSLLGPLRRYWPGDTSRYVEPFCGSACLFFDLQPSEAILGDLNQDLICTFRAVKNTPEQLLTSLRQIRKGKIGYYKLRRTPPNSLPKIDRAARFLYLNRTCFNGIYRTNLKGQFNVPYGPPKGGRTIDESVVVAASKALRDAKLVHGDFEKTLAQVKAGDFVYLDPPYCLEGRRVFREYAPKSFAIPDLRRLSNQLRRLDALGARFLITYADSAEARDLLRPWKPHRVRVRRHIAGFSYHRRHAYELVAGNCSPRS